MAWYEDGEVAHIENILEGELRRREHRRLRQLEETLTVEKVREEESEKDLQSTERFELQTESERVVKSETKFSAGLSLSAGYGPIQISANTDLGMTKSKEQSDRTATTYAKDVTERSVARLMERVREERVARVLQEFEEKNLHRFASRSQRMSGIYCWVDKYYRTWVEDYGQRLFYTFYVPEPAAFYLKAKANDKASMPDWPQAPEMAVPSDPEDPDSEVVMIPLSPELIERDNYRTLLKQYRVDNLEPPPPKNTVVAKTIARELQQSDQLALDELIEIPSGYEADYACTNASIRWSTTEGKISFHCGKQEWEDVKAPDDLDSRSIERWILSPFFSYDVKPDNIIPLTITGMGLTSLGVNIEVHCRLKNEMYEQWQIKTFNAIMTAYQKKMMEFEDKVAANEVSGAVQWGQNPNINREIEKQELKRSCISMWSEYGMGLNRAIKEDADRFGYPEIDRYWARGNAIATRFFEEAFEWENMAYEFLPYYWGNKEKWINTYTLKSEDPMFEQFLRAGAADVKVPVRPSYTAAVLYYQLTGHVWVGDPKDVPALEDVPSLIEDAGIQQEIETYNDYLDLLEEEIAAEEEGTYEELENVVESPPEKAEVFLIKVPTSLVHLRQSDELPNYESSSEPNS